MPDIMHLVRIGAPPERVYAALATAEGVRAWWTRDAGLDPRIGGTGEFRFPHYGEGAVTRVSLDLLDPPRGVGWTTTSSFHPEWAGTTMHFQLRPDEGGTVLSFAHRGFRHADEAYAMFTTGWGYYLVSLKYYVETGTGAPSPDVDFSKMLRTD